MIKADFIKELTAKANITEEQAAQVNEILEAHHIIGRNSKLAVISEIAEKLGVDQARAEEISNEASALIAGGLKNKLLHPFGGNDEDK